MTPGTSVRRMRAIIQGLVQGVGFRPFVYGLAQELHLSGWVMNSTTGVTVEVEGEADAVAAFLLRLDTDKPPRAAIHSLEPVYLDPRGYADFRIRPSNSHGAAEALVLPDIGTCAACLDELLDPGDRRYRYPFINCTHCGPRFSIIQRLPYDRDNTSMAAFELCPVCRREYEDPADRRFHAQPTACPLCGPGLGLWDADGTVLAAGDEALCRAEAALSAGAVVALKGLGGFQLLVDASNQAAVQRLRVAKHREEKPFALMYPDLPAVRAVCRVSVLEERLLCAPEAPIVLLERQQGAAGPAPAVAPGNPHLGVMLPYTPLHHLLMHDLRAAVVATSGNRVDEPICTGEREALERLGGIADLFLVHDRPICRHVDDSIVRVIAGRELVLRRARGYAPLPVVSGLAGPSVAALGAHLKNTAALSVGRRIFVGQHVGDLETPQAQAALRRSLADLQKLYGATAAAVVSDLHPDYASTHAAEELAGPACPHLRVQHHHAHVLACMADNELDGEVLGVSWDGTGYGPDGTIWGGEFMRASAPHYQRLAHMRTFCLPGGEAAVREPRRCALGLLYELDGEAALHQHHLPPVQACTAQELRVIGRMLRRQLNAPRTSSVGRLFDAVASLCGLRQRLRHEGQAAMALEYVVQPDSSAYGVTLTEEPAGGPWVLDWRELVRQLLADLAAGIAVGRVAARFHHALVEGIVLVAQRTGLERVVLTGGCMQNKYLTERAIDRLQEEGFRPYWHQRIPPNDGGISLGQVVAARARLPWPQADPA